ncbi:MAG: mannosyl-3-phosphoglycerate phosphatase [Bacteroidota bacterium]
MKNIVIYSDLDGTLIDFEDYSFNLTAPLVRKLEAMGIPVVFCSSKTREEQAYYRKEIGVNAPFITENGSAIFIPKNYFPFTFSYQTEIDNFYVIELGVNRAEILTKITKAREISGAKVYGYSDLPLAEVAQILKLNEIESQRAVSRDYSETLIKGDKDSVHFKKMVALLEQEGLACTAGGKFHTVISNKSDKGKAVKLLHTFFQKMHLETMSVGLGDSANDLPLLNAVDKPFLVQKPGKWWDDLSATNLVKIDGVGPNGWIKAVNNLIE